MIVFRHIFICFALAILCGCQATTHGDSDSPTRLALHSHWTFHADTNHATSFPATVPGTTHTDLLAAKLIPDPYYGNNEITLRALEAISWVYQTTFHLTKKQRNQKNLILTFEGLDTYADIYLNDHKLGHVENMFRDWTYNISSLVQSENKLVIKFTPPAIQNQAHALALGYSLPADNEDGELKVSPFTRKAPYHFGWDWGPRLVTNGIWKPVYVESWQGIKIKTASVTTQSIARNHAAMLTTIYIEADGSIKEITIQHGDNQTKHQLTKGENKIEIPFNISNPTLWWPHGSGEAHLYKSNISIKHNGDILDEKRIKYGIRTIELDNEKDSIGTSFYFKVNGQPMFMQGANYIPQDIFLPRVQDRQYRELLHAAKAAHMNMIRVWGGGVYEKDIFYDLCDSLGLLVWQDFMFAGTMYPGDDNFIDNVKVEVTQQVRRLSGHPCLALWCGNNELEVAWQNWGWQQKYNYSIADSTRIWNDYLKMFHEIIPSIVANESPAIDYTPTSPLSNWGTPENFNHGSMHYWGVWHGRDAFESFNHNVGRFMVEYGMQSYPQLSTIQSFTDSTNMRLDSDIMKNRQKSYIGNAEILKHIKQHEHESNSFEEFISLSQDAQAKAMEIAIRAHKNSNGHCMGTLLWQLNDCWPGPSWSIIDYNGNKKKAFEVVAHEFSMPIK